MSKMLGGVCLLTVLVVSSLTAPLYAAGTKALKRTVVAPRYDAAKEVTMEGTIQQIIKKPAPGTMFGAHLMVSTTKGTIDAHIGEAVIRGAHAYSPAAGESVKLVGVMTTINHKDVFLTRTIETGDRTIQVRTKTGFLIVPGAKGRAFTQTSAKEGAR